MKKLCILHARGHSFIVISYGVYSGLVCTSTQLYKAWMSLEHTTLCFYALATIWLPFI